MENEKGNENSENIEELSDIKIAVSKDYRGLVCPLNFVKVKLCLEQMECGEILEVLLDDGEPIENVPTSIKDEGHEIIDKTKINNYWQLKIKKV